MYPTNSIPALSKGICTEIARRPENPEISKSGGVGGKWDGFLVRRREEDREIRVGCKNSSWLV